MHTLLNACKYTCFKQVFHSLRRHKGEHGKAMFTLNEALELLTDIRRKAQVLRERVLLNLRLGHYPAAMYVYVFLN